MSTLRVNTLANQAGVEVYTAKAWVNFNGTGTVAIRASGNVSSITDNGTGNYTVNFTTAMPDANYADAVTMGILGSPTSSQMNSNNTAKNSGSFQVRFLNNTASYDYDSCDVVIFR